MKSWHELFEQNPKLVVTAAGVGGIPGKTRQEMLESQSEQYKHFRAVWDSIRKTVESWTAPKTQKGT